MSATIDDLARLVRGARTAVVLTGAGVSTDSGIPDFRSRSGLWRDADPMRFATQRGFLDDPIAFYDFWREHLGKLAEVKPNVTHEVVAHLESRGHVRSVVTQNIDGLHQAAGSKNVHEVHGTFRTVRCVECGVREPSTRAFSIVGRAPRCRVCGGLLRPDVVLFGEALGGAFEDATDDLARADLLLVLGSSLEVAPVSEMVPFAAERKIPVAIVNRERTACDDEASLVLHEDLAPTMRALRSRV
ncbi:MAG: Sir2 family NAD-dependent protein deacetylase [Deltaproteobacteria bacterium]|nr:Sir2 family NAD-dependent protein deacetylase [Deltaproteobacteria bacterium]